MAFKQLEIPSVGAVRFYKRRDARSLKITLGSRDYVRVTLPAWVPYRAGIEYVKSKANWINQNRRLKPTVSHGMPIGKAHRINLVAKADSAKITTKVVGTTINISHPTDVSSTDSAVQEAAQKASIRALSTEAKKLLPQRLEQLAKKHNFSYGNVKIRQLRSRWGSCSQQRDIALSLYLMQLPWEHIDYVILHELTHTKFLNHSPQFWAHLESCLPKAKLLRRQLKVYQPTL